MFKKKRMRKRKRRPMTRKVYLMERVTNRQWLTILTFKREIKLGIAKDAKQRNKSVNNGIPGKVILLNQYTIRSASTIESELHRRYANKNLVIRGAKEGSGSTEFFRLSTKEVNDIRAFLSNKEKRPIETDGKFFLIILVAAIVAVYLIHNLTI